MYSLWQGHSSRVQQIWQWNVQKVRQIWPWNVQRVQGIMQDQQLEMSRHAFKEEEARRFLTLRSIKNVYSTQINIVLKAHKFRDSPMKANEANKHNVQPKKEPVTINSILTENDN